MKEIPSSEPLMERGSKSIPILPLETKNSGYSKGNQKATTTSVQRAYPWLLFASTAIAAAFCVAYITKPVLLATQTPAPFEAPSEIVIPLVEPKITETSTPVPDSLPDLQQNPQISSAEEQSFPPPPTVSEFEETNIRIQHALDASSPGGEINRVLVEVPVLYKSRTLRWSQKDAAQARVLLDRLSVYQDNVRALRDEGKLIRAEWNQLIGNSIPSEVLRVDSPSLPMNQKDELTPRTMGDTSNPIKLQPATDQ